MNPTFNKFKEDVDKIIKIGELYFEYFLKIFKTPLDNTQIKSKMIRTLDFKKLLYTSMKIKSKYFISISPNQLINLKKFIIYLYNNKDEIFNESTNNNIINIHIYQKLIYILAIIIENINTFKPFKITNEVDIDVKLFKSITYHFRNYKHYRFFLLFYIFRSNNSIYDNKNYNNLILTYIDMFKHFNEYDEELSITLLHQILESYFGYRSIDNIVFKSIISIINFMKFKYEYLSKSIDIILMIIKFQKGHEKQLMLILQNNFKMLKKKDKIKFKNFFKKKINKKYKDFIIKYFK
jgi:hypothetical protein